MTMLLADLFLLRPSPYRHACESPRAATTVALFLVVTGALYGVLLSLMQRAAGLELQGVAVAEIPAYILFGGNILSGLIIAVAVHAGITLVAWMMARAIGGPGLMIGIYRSTAYLLPFGWLALPLIVRQTSLAGPGPLASLSLEWAYLPLAGVGLAFFLAGLYQIYLITQQRSPLRCGIAVTLFAVFSFCILLIA